ncbi:MAG TPA: site-specific integrase, partial [Desulfobacterales bacterium]|nr:site-specific integrase [Desulfobacterales bacterium]
MAIYWKCPSCKSSNSLSKRVCSCGERYPSPRKRKFVIQVRYKGIRKCAVADTLSQARELEVHIKEMLIRWKYLGAPKIKESPSVREFFKKQYLPWIRINLKSPEIPEALYYKWVDPVLGQKKLDEITVEDIERLKGNILAAGRSLRSAQHILGIMRAALNKAKDWDIFEGDNPVSKVKVPKFDNRRVRFLTQEEAGKLLEECKKRTTPNNWIYPIALIALSTGMRAGEIFSLKWQDVDLENNLIHIREAKSGENRTAFLSMEIREVLLRLAGKKEPSAYVFTNSTGQPFSGVPDVWRGIIKRLGFNEG